MDAVRVSSIPAKRPSTVPSEEWQARLNLAAAYRLAARLGWHDLFGNHFSLRVPGTTDQYLVNPFGLFFEEITASSLVKVDTSGKVVGPSDHGMNPAADIIHGAIMKARPDVAAIMHLHNVNGVAVASQKEGLRPISQSALMILGKVRYHDFEGPALNPEECDHLVADLGDGGILMMRNHGILTVGHTIGEAFCLMVRLDRACDIQIAALAGNSEVVLPADKVIADSLAWGKKIYGPEYYSPFAEQEWKAYMRKIERDDPGYAA